MMDIFEADISAGASYLAAFVSVVVAGVMAVKDRRSLSSRSFIAGQTLLAVAEVFRGLSNQSIIAEDVLYWQRMRAISSGLLPGTWLLFSLVFARTNYQTSLSKWKWALAAAFALPILIPVLFANFFFAELPVLDSLGKYVIPLGKTGKLFQISILIAATLILANLERTLRASSGRIRWQIKFIVLGLGVICAGWIYSSSQALLFSSLNTTIGIVCSVTVLLANLLFSWGIFRSQFFNVDVYLSRTTIQYSLTILAIGIYLLFVGLFAQFVRSFNPGRSLPTAALIFLLSLTGLLVLMMSDRLQERLQRLITRHFRRPRYDYRMAWMDLTQRTTSLSDVHQICTEVAKIISRTLGFLSVNIWLRDTAETRLRLAGSTVFTRPQAQELTREGSAVAKILDEVKNRTAPLDLLQRSYEWSEQIIKAKPEFFADFTMRYILPIQTSGQLVGVLTLNDDRVGKAQLSLEDQDLLHAYSSQLAANVLQLRLSEQLRQAKEMEAFQNVSAFFVHDLKNLASRLSLTMQNLPLHFDNPEFRTDALKAIGQSVLQMNEMCGKLSLLRQKIELKMAPTDLNDLIATLLKGIERGLNGKCETSLKPLPDIMADPEQLQKVVGNLILNANEALAGGGHIKVATEHVNKCVTLSITDTGCGMSQEFIEQSLFRPFKSTKKQGMGIGLFHSRMIVEAHHGRIDVDSQPGKGSTFRVVLPINPESIS
jgi:putative PEP-CTERM system histidine kinase